MPLCEFALLRTCDLCRAVFPKLRDRSKLLCEEVKKRKGAPLDVQDAMQRLALDMIMLAAFSMDTRAVMFEKSEILDSLHFCFEDIFRCGLFCSRQPGLAIWPSWHHPLCLKPLCSLECAESRAACPVPVRSPW